MRVFVGFLVVGQDSSGEDIAWRTLLGEHCLEGIAWRALLEGMGGDGGQTSWS